jgi:hypothetical protein
MLVISGEDAYRVGTYMWLEEATIACLPLLFHFVVAIYRHLHRSSRWCVIVLLSSNLRILTPIKGKRTYFRGDGACVIGLKHYASIPLLSYDL